MRISPVKITSRTMGAAALLVVTASAVAIQGCTDLTETPTSAITPDNYYNTQAEIIGGVAGVYSTLRNTLDEYYNVSQVSTDEIIVPTRGSDWYDNGKWLELHRQTWTPTSAAGLDNINSAWSNLWSGVARANAVITALKPNQVPNQAAIEGELRALRAFYYIALMDLFGPVPIVTTTEIKERPQNTRKEVLEFVEKELIAARAGLPAKWDASNWGRVTQGAVDAMLTSIYLNAEVYGGTVSASGIAKGPARWADVITTADKIINSGTYSLASNWDANFRADNQNSAENIFVVRFSTVDGLGLNLNMRSFHYNSSTAGGWNGFSTVSDTYNAFDAADRRRAIFLVGPQINQSTGAPINDRAGNRLIFTPEIKDPTAANEGEGARIYKFTIDKSVTNQNQPNDFPHYRLGEVYLSKAEAQNELGQTAAAIATINQIRARVFAPAKPLATSLSQAQARTAIFNERLFELTGEGKRRQDMIRAGSYTRPFQFKTNTDAYRVLMPIPQSQLATNSLLKQNPGY